MARLLMDLAALFADVSAGLSAQFGGPYFAARIVQQGEPVTDDGGSIITPGQPSYRACMAQVDVMTEAMRAQDGYAERDVRILILQGSIEQGAPLDTDGVVRIDAGPNVGAWAIQSVGADSLAIYFEVRGRPA